MSMLARRSLRGLPRATRSYSATGGDVAKSSYHEKQLALEHHAARAYFVD